MSANLKRAIDVLSDALSEKDSRKRKAILSHYARKDYVYKGLREIAKNIINGKLKLNKRQKTKINKHSKIIKKLVKGTPSKITQRRLVEMSGGYIQWIIPLVSTLISALT